MHTDRAIVANELVLCKQEVKEIVVNHTGFIISLRLILWSILCAIIIPHIHLLTTHVI